MPYMIDGTDLITKLSRLSFQDIDDEMQLVDILQDFCRLKNKQSEVFFDNSPPGGMRVRKFDQVTVRYIRHGQPLESAIQGRLSRLEKEARNWIVISSNHAVIRAANASKAQAMSSSDFAKKIEQTLNNQEIESQHKEESALQEEEIDEWLDLFGIDDLSE
jgi:predicted RNA-binding protein with PIN domain